MRPAAEMHQAVGLGDAVVDLVAVGHQHRAWLDAGIEFRGVGPPRPAA
jgi:hypothetical protein